MANSILHTGLPYPIRNCRYTIVVPFVDSTGGMVDPTSPDSEVSIDGGAFADCSNEITTISSGNGVGYLTLTSSEMGACSVAVVCKSANALTATVFLQPRQLPVMAFATLTSGDVDYVRYETINGVQEGFNATGLVVTVDSGTGTGQARVITGYSVSSTQVALTVSPNWETTPIVGDGVSFRLLTGMTREAMLPTGGAR